MVNFERVNADQENGSHFRYICAILFEFEKYFIAFKILKFFQKQPFTRFFIQNKYSDKTAKFTGKRSLLQYSCRRRPAVFRKKRFIAWVFLSMLQFFSKQHFLKRPVTMAVSVFFSHIFSWYCMKFYVLFHRFLGQVKRLKLFFFLVVLKGLTQQ